MLSPTPFPIPSTQYTRRQRCAQSQQDSSPLVLPPLPPQRSAISIPIAIHRPSTAVAHLGRPILLHLIAIPVPACLPPRPSHRSPRSTRRLPPAKNCVGQERRRGDAGAGAVAPGQGNPSPRSVSSPPDGTKLPPVFPFCISYADYKVGTKVQTFSVPSPSDGSIRRLEFDLRPRPRNKPDPPSTNLSRLGSPFPHSLQHARQTLPPLWRPLVCPFQILLDLLYSRREPRRRPWLPRPNRAASNKATTTTLPSTTLSRRTIVRAVAPPYALPRWHPSPSDIGSIGRYLTSRAGRGQRSRPAREGIPGMTIAS
jgi:hypothetical protein